MIDLLPCPFCGDIADQFAGDTFCSNKKCGALIQAVTRDESGKLWNVRHEAARAKPSEPAGDKVERVARAICRAEHLEHGEDQEAEAWRMWHERFEYLAKAAMQQTGKGE